MVTALAVELLETKIGNMVQSNSNAHSSRQAETDTERTPYVVFGVGEMQLALEIEHVLSVEPVLPITPVPDVPPCLVGVVNLRGNIIAVVDLAQIYGQTAGNSHESDSILMVSVGGHTCGLLTAHTGDVYEVSDTEIVPPLPTPAGPQLFRGLIDLNGQLVGVIDTARLSTILMGDTRS